MYVTFCLCLCLLRTSKPAFKVEQLVHVIYYSTHCNVNATQIWPWCAQHSSFAHSRYPAIYVISCVVERNGRVEIVSNFSAIKRCFVINVLNNKTIILLNLAEYHQILANSAFGIVD